MEKLNNLITISDKVSKFTDEFDDNLRLKFAVKKIAFKIFFELKRQNLSQLDLANLLDITPENINKLLKGDDYKLSTLVKIEEVLAINLIDRNIYNDIINISAIIHINSFDSIKKPLIVGKNSYCINDAFNSSTNVLETVVYNKRINFEKSIEEPIEAYF